MQSLFYIYLFINKKEINVFSNKKMNMLLRFSLFLTILKWIFIITNIQNIVHDNILTYFKR